MSIDKAVCSDAELYEIGQSHGCVKRHLLTFTLYVAQQSGMIHHIFPDGSFMVSGWADDSRTYELPQQ